MTPTTLALCGAALHLKTAAFSDGVGRYFAAGPAFRSAVRASPGKGYAGMLAGSLIPGLNYLGSAEAGAALAGIDGDSEKDREAQVVEAAKQHAGRSYGDAAKVGVTGNWPLILLGALGGAGGGAAYGVDKSVFSTPLKMQPTSSEAKITDGVLGAGLGGLAGGGLAALVGALSGVTDKAILSNVDPQNVEDIAKGKARNRVLSALPLGDAFLAANVGK